MATIAPLLAQIAGLPAKDKPTAYRDLTAALFTPNSPHLAAIPANVDSLLNDLVSDGGPGLVVARPVANDLVAAMVDATTVDTSTKRRLYEIVIDRLTPRLVSFEDPVALAREKLSAILEDEEEWTEAARMLMNIPMDTGHRQVTDEYKLRIYIHIVRLLLEDEDSVTAETYLNRAGFLIGPDHDPVLQLTYKMCHGRILDAKRKFLEASQKYLELSYAPQLHPDEKNLVLQKAVTCTVLAEAGPHRSRLLAQLYKDDRVHKLPQVFVSMVEKMYLGRILRAHEVSDFSETLAGHHLAKLADGSTVLDRAVIQHNLLSASRIYANISLAELGRLLGVDAAQAETTAARMITERRLLGHLDQIDGFLYFQTQGVLSSWDARVAALCGQVDDVVAAIQKRAAVPAATA
ncbi:hypothetical protein GGF31_008357 [Allomyces arbusculus]|nr:hypothetical protein GGF31_008357 [Allomyces arbusculus]